MKNPVQPEAFWPQMRIEKQFLPALAQEELLAWLRDVFVATAQEKQKLSERVASRGFGSPADIKQYQKQSQRAVDQILHAGETLCLIEEPDYWKLGFAFKNDHPLFATFTEGRRPWLCEALDVNIFNPLISFSMLRTVSIISSSPNDSERANATAMEKFSMGLSDVFNASLGETERSPQGRFYIVGECDVD